MSLVLIPEETKVILVGCSNFLEDNTLNQIKPIEANLAALKDIFTDKNIFNGIPDGNIVTILNKNDYEIMREVEEIAQTASDTLIVYYAGHGEREKGRTLYLTATNTKRDRLISTAIEFERLNKVIQISKASKKFLILDCCYSGLAALNADNDPLQEEDFRDIKGTYILTSSPSNMVSYFHKNENYTFFTLELINILRNGIENNTPFIEIGEIYEHIKSNLKKKNFPGPMQKNTLNASGKIYFANNYKHIDYSKKVSIADTLLREDEFTLALEKYKTLIDEFRTYNNENIELKVKSILAIQSAETLFNQSKYETANKQLISANEILESIEFKTGKIFDERKKIYSLIASTESKLKEDIKNYLEPLIRKEMENEFLREPNLIEYKLREQLEQEYRIKATGLEQELRQKIYQEYKDSLQGNLNGRRLLIVASNPINTAQLRIDEEIREIYSALKHNNTYLIFPALATKANELDQILLEINPEILHVTAHVSLAGEFYFEDMRGQSVPINGRDFVNLIKMFSSIKIALINTCYAEEIAYLLSEYVPYVISFAGAVTDLTSISFAKSFYKAFASRGDVQFAFDFATTTCNLVYNRDERPVLFKQEDFMKKKQSITVNLVGLE